ncbi:MAG TPA: amino acid adenylation domain-containing protein, partial [Mycobacteriales bacterium]|nr:amino acid adenylation domain-containing protein [Mycobacteriales bacterium]
MGSSLESATLVHPASYAQRQLWFLEQLDPGQPAYHINVAVELRADATPDSVRRTLAELIDRHESLRTVFVERDGAPMQVVLPSVEVELAVTDLRGQSAAAAGPAADRCRQQAAGTPFDLAAGPLLRAHLLRHADRTELVLIVHHLVADAWSIRVLLREFGPIHDAVLHGRPSPLPELPIQYADYAAWQASRTDGPEGAAALAYWRAQLAELPTLDLPTDFPRPAAPGLRGGAAEVSLPGSVATALAELGRRHGATLFMTVLAGYAALLHRYSGQHEVVVGSPVAGRDVADLEQVVGLFVNRLVLRLDLGGNPTFTELLGRVRRVCLDAYAHQQAPFERLVEELAPVRDAGRAPLFQVGFNLLPQMDAGMAAGPGDGHQFRNGTVRHDLNLDVAPDAAGLTCLLEYRDDLFRPETAARMAAALGRILTVAAARPDTRIGALPLHTAGERRELTRPAGPPAGTGCLHQTVAGLAGRIPDAPAVVGADGELCYAALHDRAIALARRLAGHGVRRGDVVGVCLEPSAALVVAMLGTLHAGAGYLPLDPAAPPARRGFQLADAGVRLVLTAADPPPLPPGVTALSVHIGQSDVDGHPAGVADPLPVVTPGDLAYVIYTSGSTGRPKGVAVEHRQLSAYAGAITARVGFAEGDVSAMLQPPTFDSSVTMLVGALTSGGCLRLVDPATARDPGAVAALFRAHPADHLKITPSHLAALRAGTDPAAVLPRRALILGGEAAPPELVLDLVEHAGCAVHNHYGPTETTVGVLSGQVEPGSLTGTGTAPLGRPLVGVGAYLLDRYLQPVPIGVPGEIYLGGHTVTRGYLGRPGLTAAAFRPDPFSTEPGSRMYRTGDRARRLPDGRIEYLGRVDDQVKIRGVRVEPAEVAAVLAEHPDVASAAVVARAGPAGDRLVGYVTARAGALLSADDLRAQARRLLPEQLVPAAVVVLDALPLTAHGKVDRAALPDPAPAPRPTPTAPRTPAEEALAAVWRDVLGVTGVSVDDNFFDLGGDSILSILVVARAREAGYALTVRQVFAHQTIAAAAAVAVPVGGGAGPAAGGEPGPAPLTPNQAAFLARAAAPDRFTQGLWVDLAAEVDLPTLRRALDALVTQHDALRLRVRRTAGGWQQSVAAAGEPVRLDLFDLTGIPAAERAAAAERHAIALESTVDLAGGRVLAGAVADAGAAGRRLLLIAHHFAVDAVSWRILLADLQVAYRQLAGGRPDVTLPPAGITFAGWTRLLAAEAAGPETAAEAAYWSGPTRTTARPLLAANPDPARPDPTDSDPADPDPADPDPADPDLAGASRTGAGWAEAGQTDPGQTDTGRTAARRAEAGRVEGRQTDPGQTDTGRTADGRAEAGRAEVVWVGLDGGTSAALVETALAAYGNQVLDVLLAGLALALREAAGGGPVLVELEGHGRAELRDGVDPSRTVGWFTVGYPAALDLDPAAGPGAALIAAKEQLRAVPRGGVGYGMLRHGGVDPAVAARLAAQPTPDVGFNYLGQLDRLLGGLDLFGPRPPELRERSTRRHLIDVDAVLDGGRLAVGWTYDPARFDRGTIDALARRHLAEVRTLVEHASARTAPTYTPSDFPLAELDQPGLDALAGALGIAPGPGPATARPAGPGAATGRPATARPATVRPATVRPAIEDVYPLSPVQQAMLFETLAAPTGGVYVQQFLYRLVGELDPAAFRRAWAAVLARHPVLRTAFVWPDRPRPLQAVLAEVELPWSVEDLRLLAPAEQLACARAHLAEVARDGLPLTRAPQLRLALWRTGEREHLFAVSNHHLVLDAWSRLATFREAMALYAAELAGRPAGLPPAPGYGDYVALLQRLEPGDADRFWRRYLAGAGTGIALPGRTP